MIRRGTGHLFVFRGRTRANLIKIIYWEGNGFCLFTKRLDQGVFLWPPTLDRGATLSLTSAQLPLLIEGVDWWAVCPLPAFASEHRGSSARAGDRRQL